MLSPGDTRELVQARPEASEGIVDGLPLSYVNLGGICFELVPLLFLFVIIIYLYYHSLMFFISGFPPF